MKVLRTLAVIVILILIEALVVWLANSLNGGTYLQEFIWNHSLPIMGTLLGLNVAAAVFILGHLTTIEISLNKKDIFTGSRQEIKHSIFMMLVVFSLNLVLLLIAPSRDATFLQLLGGFRISFASVSLFLFLLHITAIFEITLAVFALESITREEN